MLEEREILSNEMREIVTQSPMVQRKQDNQLAKMLMKTPKEDLIEEVIFLRRRVDRLEKQLADTLK